jgi:hypothetical protein
VGLVTAEIWILHSSTVSTCALTHSDPFSDMLSDRQTWSEDQHYLGSDMACAASFQATRLLCLIVSSLNEAFGSVSDICYIQDICQQAAMLGQTSPVVV